jgi:prepilin-type N-terminal cleavage/methylation domain-containing protein
MFAVPELFKYLVNKNIVRAVLYYKKHFMRRLRKNNLDCGHKGGFTLIELLVAIVILGIITTLAVFSIGNVRTKARDTKRIGDIRGLQTALEMYNSDNSGYPNPGQVTAGLPLSGPNGDVYMQRVPTALGVRDGTCTADTYNYQSTDSKTYIIRYCLGGKVQSAGPGDCIAVPGNICGVPPPPAVGDNYRGGIIFYIFQPGDLGYFVGETHGLIAAPNDQPGTFQWGCNSNASVTSLSVNIGTGKNNTFALSSCSSPATQEVYGVNINGYNDWYLPSLNELKKLYDNRLIVGNFQADGNYWSSSGWGHSFDSTNIMAHGYTFQTNNDLLAYRTNSYRVRAVRSF